jgi:hypothetical protein
MDDDKGPKLDGETIDLLTKYILVNKQTLVIFSQFPFDEEMEIFSDEEVSRLTGQYGLHDFRAYGLYLSSNELITKRGLINHEGFLPINYAVFRKTQRRKLSRHLLCTSCQQTFAPYFGVVSFCVVVLSCCMSCMPTHLYCGEMFTKMSQWIVVLSMFVWWI